jgi:hypothetical protein
MSQSNQPDGSNPPTDAAWFDGDRRLYVLHGPLDQEGQDNPERLQAGHRVLVPRVVSISLGLDPDLTFTLVETRCFAFGSMGFCEVDGQAGRGAWIRLRSLSRSEWHTRQERSRPVRQR